MRLHTVLKYYYPTGNPAIGNLLCVDNKEITKLDSCHFTPFVSV